MTLTIEQLARIGQAVVDAETRFFKGIEDVLLPGADPDFKGITDAAMLIERLKAVAL